MFDSGAFDTASFDINAFSFADAGTENMVIDMVKSIVSNLIDGITA